MIAEGANGPITPKGQEILHEYDILIIPVSMPENWFF